MLEQAKPAVEHFFVQLIGIRPGWPENMTADEQRIMKEHYHYLKNLVAEKIVLMAGPVFDPVFGLIILRVRDKSAAMLLMENEPSVRQGVHTYKISPMTVSLMADYRSPERYPEETSDKIIRKEIIVPATLEHVWETWTTTDGVKTFFSSAAKVELRPGGPFEIYFLLDKPYGSRGSEDCQILSFLPMQMLSFEWSAPPEFGELRRKRTQVILQFTSPDQNQVRVSLSHVGWGISEEWNRLYDYFDNAWSYVLRNLKKRFDEGPINWSDV
jgi:uncharacterized protein YndB with AHSA1/START domain/uncharacterized protein YciI